MVGTAAHPEARYGRSGDSMMAHVSPGEYIVPKPVLDANPHLAAIIANAVMNAGGNPEDYEVGDDMSYNPETGNPEFRWKGWKKIWKAATKVVPVAAGYLLGGPPGAAIGGAVGSAARGGDLRQILQGAGYGYGAGSLVGAGSNALSAYGAASSGAPVTGVGPVGPGGVMPGLRAAGGSLYNSAMAPMSTAEKFLQAAKLGDTFLGQGLGRELNRENREAISQQKISDPSFTPERPSALSRPASLGELSGYSPEQERSALATKGVNIGLGGDEQSYYRNLIQRSLIGDGGQVNTSNPNYLLPIESQYFSRQGLNTSDQMKFLQQLHS